MLASSLAFIAVFGALGSGLAVELPLSPSARIVLAPILGLALSAASLTTAALFIPMEVAAWVLLVPAMLVSVFWCARRGGLQGADWNTLILPAAVGAAALTLATSPGLIRGTAGPISLAVFDALGYVQTDEWLQTHTAREPAPHDATRWDLDQAYGRALVAVDQRIGVSAVSAAVASLLRLHADEVNLAFLAGLLALVSFSVWFLARELGAGRLGSFLGAAFGLSPAILLLVVDSALANLAGLVLVPPTLLLLTRAIDRGPTGEIVAAGVLLAGLIAVYPEFLTPTAFILSLAVGTTWIRDWHRHPFRSLARESLLRVGTLVAVTVVVAPAAFARALVYLNEVRSGAIITGQPPRFLTLENAGSWAFGVLHLYQLPRFDLLSAEKRAIAFLLPFALAVVILIGVFRRSLQPQLLIVAPIGASVILGLLALRRFQDGHCQYCLWKSLTYMLPFLGVGVAVGIERTKGVRFILTRKYLATPVFAIVVAGIASLLYADQKLIQAQRHSPAAIEPELRGLRSTVNDLPVRAHIFLEGADTSASPKWSLPSAYFMLDAPGDDRISFTATGDSALYLGAPALTSPFAYYSTAYEYVVTPFSGLETNRKLISRSGHYGLYYRAPVDVAIVGTGWSLDPKEEDPIVWTQAPFELWVSSPRSERGSITFATEARPTGSALQLSAYGRPLVGRAQPKQEQCVELGLRRGVTVVTATPLFASSPQVPARATESDPVPPPAKVLGLTALEAGLGKCKGSGKRRLSARFVRGWWPLERDAAGNPFRWMRTSATVRIGSPGQRRPRSMLRAHITSLAVERSLTVRFGNKRVLTVKVPANFRFRPLELPIPAGTGVVTLSLSALPSASPAKLITRGDPRRLAVGFRDLTIAAGQRDRASEVP